MNPVIAIRLECLRLAQAGRENVNSQRLLDLAKSYEKHVRRGIRVADLGGGCGCHGKADTVEAQRKRQQLLMQDAKALIDSRLEPMTLVQLVTDYDLTFPQNDADRIDAVLRKYQLRRNVTGDCLAKWIETGLLPQAKGKAYTP